MTKLKKAWSSAVLTSPWLFIQQDWQLWTKKLCRLCLFVFASWLFKKSKYAKKKTLNLWSLWKLASFCFPSRPDVSSWLLGKFPLGPNIKCLMWHDSRKDVCHASYRQKTILSISCLCISKSLWFVFLKRKIKYSVQVSRAHINFSLGTVFKLFD